MNTEEIRAYAISKVIELGWASEDHEGEVLLLSEASEMVKCFEAGYALAASVTGSWEGLHDAVAELLEVAALRGDDELPHPCDDPKLWSARMQTAWHELVFAFAAAPVVESRPDETRALEIVQRLADWSRKYPRGTVYSASGQPSMDALLIAMEEDAKALLPAAPLAPKAS